MTKHAKEAEDAAELGEGGWIEIKFRKDFFSQTYQFPRQSLSIPKPMIKNLLVVFLSYINRDYL